MIKKATALGAGNVYARRPVIELRLARHARTLLPPGAGERLIAALPPMREEVLDFPALRRLAAAEGPVPEAAFVELLAVIAQRYMNWPVGFCSWRPGSSKEARRAVFEAGTPRVGLRAGKIAAEVLEVFWNEASAGLDALFREKLAYLSRTTARETPSIDALAIARAAASRGIAWSTLPGSTYLRLGAGRHARILMGAESTNTSSVAREIARRKRVTTTLLAAAGLPTAAQRTVRRLEDAQAAARAIGFPVVIKPASGNMGKGVSVGVADEAGVAAAYERARSVSRDVLVEALIVGEEFRLLVIDGRFIAAARRRPAQIRGDGVSTVRQLVARENARPERETILPGRMAARLPIVLDAGAVALLSEQGHTEEAVPAAGEVVLLRRESNVSRGGDSIDETERVHPSIRSVAERAATVVGIDVCGVDFISSDIRRPWWETGAAICEMNTRPGLTLHSRVSEGQRHDVAADVLRMLYADGAPTRVPTVAMLESPEAASLRDAIVAEAVRAGRRLGVVCPSEGSPSFDAPVRRLDGAPAVSWDERIDAAVVEVSAEAVAKGGLGLERIDLAILPHGDSSRSVSRASAALARAAGNQVVSGGDPRALAKALTALGLQGRGSSARQTLPAVVAARRMPEGEREADSFTVLMVGDIGFGEPYLGHPRAAPLKHLLGTHGYGHCFTQLNPLLGSADLVIGNLEAPLSGRLDSGLSGRKKYLVWSDAEPAAQALKEAGIHAVSLANNHALDCGTAGLVETIGWLDGCGIASFGAGSDLEAAERPLIASFTLAGVERSLVVFAGFEHRQRYERRYRWYARQGTAGVVELSAATIGESIRALRDSLPSPIFIANPHWGIDYKDVADHQRTYAAELVEAGIDLVIGHGSHTAQAIEIIGDRPVIYGLGNFVWNTPGRYAKLQAKPYGLAAALEFRAGTPGEIGMRLYPILTDNSITGFQNRPVTEAEFIEAARDVSARLERKPRTSADAAGLFLEVEVTCSRPGEHRSADTPAGAAALELVR